MLKNHAQHHSKQAILLANKSIDMTLRIKFTRWGMLAVVKHGSIANTHILCLFKSYNMFQLLNKNIYVSSW